MTTVIEFSSLVEAQVAFDKLRDVSPHIKLLALQQGRFLIISTDDLTHCQIPQAANVRRIHSAYPLASLELQAEKTTVHVGSVTIGQHRPVIIAGPCSVESREQLMAVAERVARLGCQILRGGAFKPRTSPYSFQGLGLEGLKLLTEARERFGIPVISEVLAVNDLPMVLDYVDMVQIGARNMQNFPLLTAVGKTGKPVLLKRNPSATIETWLHAAEYILSEGNSQVVLCERGVCSSGVAGGYHFDLEAVLRLRQLTHLPLIVDPSHGTHTRRHVIPMALAGLVIGADGIMIEVHPDPDRALSDGPQSLDLSGLSTLMETITRLPLVSLRV